MYNAILEFFNFLVNEKNAIINALKDSSPINTLIEYLNGFIRALFQLFNKDNNFKFMWLAILFSFAFYILVVLWANEYPWIGFLMIPKTLAYVWVVTMGYREFKKVIE